MYVYVPDNFFGFKTNHRFKSLRLFKKLNVYLFITTTVHKYKKNIFFAEMKVYAYECICVRTMRDRYDSGCAIDIRSVCGDNSKIFHMNKSYIIRMYTQNISVHTHTNCSSKSVTRRTAQFKWTKYSTNL